MSEDVILNVDRPENEIESVISSVEGWFILHEQPTSVTLLNGPATSTLNLTTTARPVTTVRANSSAGRFYAIWLTAPGLALLGLGVGSDRRRRRMMGMLLLCLLFALLLLQPACSHTTTPPVVSGTPAGTYTITLTGTAGGDAKSTTFVLTVP